MSDAKTIATSTSISSFPVFSILTVILMIAKLTGHFAYSWWLVFAPLFFPLALFFVIMLGILIIGLIGLAGVAIYKALKG